MTLPESSDGDLHVSPPPPGWDPADTGTGTLDDPFHSVQTAIRAAHGGRTVWLAEGQYIEEVKLDKVLGTETNRIRVQPYPGALTSIDCLETRFLNPTTGGAWEKIDEGRRTSTGGPCRSRRRMPSRFGTGHSSKPRSCRHRGTPDWSPTTRPRTSVPSTSCFPRTLPPATTTCGRSAQTRPIREA